MRPVLVSGGSGMLGSAVRQALGARQISVVQLVRREANGHSQVQWDPAATRAIANPEALEGLSAAIHLSGASLAGHRWTPAYKRALWLSRVESTQALATALAGLRNPPSVLLVASAAGIYGNRGDELMDERSRPGSGFLSDLCVAWEAAARPALDAGIRVVHTRFGVVLGKGSGALAKMLPLFRLGLGGRLGSGRQWMSWVSMPDAVAAILYALDRSDLDGAINVAGPNPVTNAQFTQALARAIHRPAFLPAPAFALRLALGEMAGEALLASARVFPSRLISVGFQFAHPTVDVALAAALA
ncbi:MAG: TIGR01777 family oxidoreductase [Terracidiphilus sp.]